MASAKFLDSLAEAIKKTKIRKHTQNTEKEWPVKAWTQRTE